MSKQGKLLINLFQQISSCGKIKHVLVLVSFLAWLD